MGSTRRRLNGLGQDVRGAATGRKRNAAHIRVMEQQARQPQGQSTGGQFAARHRAADTVTLPARRPQAGEYHDEERHDWLSSSHTVEVNDRTGLTDDEFNSSVDQYLGTALWQGIDPSDENGAMLDENYRVSDFTDDARARACADLQDFIGENRTIVDQALDHPLYGGQEPGSKSTKGERLTRLGHDFWLTRIGAGVSFADNLASPLGTDLDTAARQYPELTVDVSNGKLFFN